MTPAQETSERELLACPFCGGEPEYVCDSDHHGAFFKLGCKDENCCAHWTYYTEPQENAPDCILRWNTRAAGDAPAWLDISTAPKDGTFLVYLPGERRQFEVMYRRGDVSIIGGAFGFDRTKPTHWQPLPAAPHTRPVRCTESSAPGEAS